MDEITFQVVNDEDPGWLVASRDAPDGSGGLRLRGVTFRICSSKSAKR
jgi:hypothetical protein